MNRQEQILAMRRVLEHRYNFLHKALVCDLATLKELRSHPQPSGDVADNATNSVHDDVTTGLAEVESSELYRVKRALELMRQGQYGVCEDCGCNIPMLRLNALPCATRCISCQRKAEQRQSQRTALRNSIELEVL